MRRWLSTRAPLQSADVDEVAREVYLRLSRYSDDVLAECPQEHLFRIATSVTDEWRERAGDGDAATIQNGEVARPAHESLVNEEVRAAVGRLEPRQQEALLLHVNEELNYRQVAARMKLAPRVVRRDIVRAYANLRYDLPSAKLDDLSAP